MGDVEKVEVGLPRKGWSALLKKFTPLLGSRELPKNKLLVTLKQVDILCQKAALALN
jgi:hypothetical protein